MSRRLKPVAADRGELDVCDPKQVCPVCGGGRKRKDCDACRRGGFVLTRALKDLWSRPAFLVCGGPSLKSLNLDRLRERGVVSLGVNNVAGYAPVDAWVYSDGQTKFHHGLYLDPKVLTFCPTPKLTKRLRVKLGTEFRMTDTTIGECPNTFGFQRSGRLYPRYFFDTFFAQWGFGGRQERELQPFRRLCTMLLGIRLLHYLGCRTIYLLGVDFWIDTNQPYAFNQAKGGGNNAWKKNEEMLRMSQGSFDRAGVKIFNCNPKSHLQLFPFLPYDEAIATSKGWVPSEPFDLSDWYTKSITRTMKGKYPDPLTL